MSQDGVPDPRVRAADADRERIVEQLRQHTADGRLTMDEFEQRMSAAYEAKTYGELAQLTADLPVDLSSLPRGGASFGKGTNGTSRSGWPLGGAASTSGTGTAAGGSSGSGTSATSPHPADIAAAVIGAAMDFRAQRHVTRQAVHDQVHQLRDAMRAERHEARLVRRRRAPVVAAITGWATLSVLLTAIWFLSGVTGSGHFGDFWPVWPITILGILTLGRVAGGAASRRSR